MSKYFLGPLQAFFFRAQIWEADSDYKHLREETEHLWTNLKSLKLFIPPWWHIYPCIQMHSSIQHKRIEIQCSSNTHALRGGLEGFDLSPHQVMGGHGRSLLNELYPLLLLFWAANTVIPNWILTNPSHPLSTNWRKTVCVMSSTPGWMVDYS